MKIAGIIAEYDPFHNGHAWQLAAAKQAGAQRVVVCLSTAATQRGALPLLPEEVRIKAALSCGADAVFSLPAVYACSGAEQFARAGVAILAAAGCDTLVFGAETPDAEALMGCARVLCSTEYQVVLKAQLAGGARNFAGARQAAIETLCPTQGYAQMLSNPNDNLAVEYCKAIIEQNAALIPYPLPRVGAGHGQALAQQKDAAGTKENGGAQNEAPQYASGSALRKLWQKGGAAAVKPYVPAVAYEYYLAAQEAGAYTNWDKVDVALLSRLRAYVPAGFGAVRGVAEGLEYRLADALKTAVTADGLYDALTTVRYPRARMRRLCMDAAMQVGAVCDAPDACAGQIAKTAQTAQHPTIPPLPPYLHLLGGRKESFVLLKNATLPASASLAELREKSRDCAVIAAFQVAYGDFSALCMANSTPMSASYTKKIVIF